MVSPRKQTIVEMLRELGEASGYRVEVDRPSERFRIRYDVAWYLPIPAWWKELIGEAGDVRGAPSRMLVTAFEVESGDIPTKYMRGNIYNVSLAPFGVCVVERGDIRERMRRVLEEFTETEGRRQVLIVSFEDVERWHRKLISGTSPKRENTRSTG